MLTSATTCIALFCICCSIRSFSRKWGSEGGTILGIATGASGVDCPISCPTSIVPLCSACMTEAFSGSCASTRTPVCFLVAGRSLPSGDRHRNYLVRPQSNQWQQDKRKASVDGDSQPLRGTEEADCRHSSKRTGRDSRRAESRSEYAGRRGILLAFSFSGVWGKAPAQKRA